MESTGCTPPELRLHLESKFQPGMTWDNYGRYGWHIDHIKPIAIFDMTDPAQAKEALHYTNLQPLWAKDNYSKYKSVAPAPGNDGSLGVDKLDAGLKHVA